MMATIRGIFIGQGGLRAGWRFAVFACLWYWLADSDYGLSLLVERIYRFPTDNFTVTDLLVWDAINLTTLLAVTALLLKLEKRRWSWIGLGVDRGTLALYGWGCLSGALLTSLVLFASWIGGDVTLRGLAIHGADFYKYLVLWSLEMLIGTGLGEELLFRGYAQSALVRGVGFWPAALFISLLFGGDHLSKPMETVPDIVNIVLFGLFCAYSVRRTGSLWFAIGFHGAFDFFALSLYGSPNTLNEGLPLDHHLLDSHIAGPTWLTGGPQGLEASWLIPPMLAVMFVLIHKMYPNNRYPHD